MFGFEYEGAKGHFTPVRVNETPTLDFDNWDHFEMHHYAFHVSDAQFDAIFGRSKKRAFHMEAVPFHKRICKPITGAAGAESISKSPTTCLNFSLAPDR